MRIADVIRCLEEVAPPQLQESYDNSGLIVGNAAAEVNGVLVCLDSTPEVVSEAVETGCNLIVAHHPIIFSGLKHLTGRTYVERTVIDAIKNDVAIYAIHTNLDNVLHRGVNSKIADRLGLSECRILSPKSEDEPGIGSGLVGKLSQPMIESDFLAHLKRSMRVEVIRHTRSLGRMVDTVAVCGGSGSFLLDNAKAAGAQVFVTADFKYHQFFDAEDDIVIADIGHYESEQFTVELICEIISDYFPNFAPNSSKRASNPIIYHT